MDWGETAQAVTVVAALVGVFYAARAAKYGRHAVVLSRIHELDSALDVADELMNAYLDAYLAYEQRRLSGMPTILVSATPLKTIDELESELSGHFNSLCFHLGGLGIPSLAGVVRDLFTLGVAIHDQTLELEEVVGRIAGMQGSLTMARAGIRAQANQIVGDSVAYRPSLRTRWRMYRYVEERRWDRGYVFPWARARQMEDAGPEKARGGG